MRVVGVKQLKARLSEYLREVRRGEAFLVTDRDEVVAELRPARPRTDAAGHAFEHALEALTESGQVAPARLPKGDWTWSVGGAGLPEGAAARLLDELREERGQ